VYFLYNTRCVYRLANSDIDNMLRFSFDGVLITDRSDGKADRAELAVGLTSETCGPMSSEVVQSSTGGVSVPPMMIPGVRESPVFPG
jgi:hypothetical protein